jgi:hypothetical protein
MSPTNDINLFKDVIIPLLPFLLAVIVFFTFVWQERKKLRLKAEDDIMMVSKSIYRDLFYLQEQWKLFGLEKTHNQVNSNRITLDLLRIDYQLIKIKLI